MPHPSKLILSICIPTFNRADFLRVVLSALLKQITQECEIVVSDNASTDATADVAQEYARSCDRVRYFRQAQNVGIDRNIDDVVKRASAEYCWLMADDDMLKPDAIVTAVSALHDGPSLVVANVEYRNVDLSLVVKKRALHFGSDRFYEPPELDRLFLEAGHLILFIGSIIIKRSIWMERERSKYYDTFLVHLGVIFQKALPGTARVIAKPLVIYRCGNSHSSELIDASFKICTINFADVVRSLALSDAIKANTGAIDRLPSLGTLLFYRALGWYSRREYLDWIRPRATSITARVLSFIIASSPGTLLNVLYLFYYRFAVKTEEGALMMQHLRASRFSPRRINWLT